MCEFRPDPHLTSSQDPHQVASDDMSGLPPRPPPPGSASCRGYPPPKRGHSPPDPRHQPGPGPDPKRFRLANISPSVGRPAGPGLSYRSDPLGPPLDRPQPPPSSTSKNHDQRQWGGPEPRDDGFRNLPPPTGGRSQPPQPPPGRSNAPKPHVPPPAPRPTDPRRRPDEYRTPAQGPPSGRAGPGPSVPPPPRQPYSNDGQRPPQPSGPGPAATNRPPQPSQPSAPLSSFVKKRPHSPAEARLGEKRPRVLPVGAPALLSARSQPAAGPAASPSVKVEPAAPPTSSAAASATGRSASRFAVDPFNEKPYVGPALVSKAAHPSLPNNPLAPPARSSAVAPEPPAVRVRKARKPDKAVPPPLADPSKANNTLILYEGYLKRLTVAANTAAGKGGPKKKIPIIGYAYDVPDDTQKTIVRCTITLPPETFALKTSATSDLLEKAKARSQAAMELLEELWRAGEVDDQYFPDGPVGPKPESILQPGMNEATYKIKEPAFWGVCEAELAKGLEKSRDWYPTLVTLPPLCADPSKPDAPLPFPLRPLLLLTPVPLPAFSSKTPIKVFTPNSKTSEPVRLTPMPRTALSIAQYAMAEHFTRRLLRAILNQALDLEPGKVLPYLVLPPSGSLRDVDWEEVEHAQGEAFEVWNWRDPDALELQARDAMTTGKNEFSRRFEVKALRRDLSPLSSPDDSPREKAFSSILEYITSTSTKFTGISDENQPLLEIEQLPPVQSHLRYLSHEEDLGEDGVKKEKIVQKYIIPELSYRSTLRHSTFQSGSYLPSVFVGLATQFQIFELHASLLNGVVREELALTALTTPGAEMEDNYEELEYIGDAVLKYISTVFLFTNKPRAREGDMGDCRKALVGNQFLLTKVIESGLTAYIRHSQASPKAWLPFNMERVSGGGYIPSLSVGKVARDKQQVLGDKLCADVLEALIGAAFETGGMASAWSFCQLVKFPIGQVPNWADFARLKPAPSTITFPPHILETAEKLQGRIGYRFKDVTLLHQSLARNGRSGPDFQRLEFLGDAILDMLVIDYLRRRFPGFGNGELVAFKSNIVSNIALAAFCVEMDLHVTMQWENAQLWNTVSKYARQAAKAKEDEVAAAHREGRQLKVYWADLDPPKEIGDMVEALIGGLMVDGGFSGIEPRLYFFDVLFEPFFNKYIKGFRSLPNQPVNILSAIFGKRHCSKFKIAKTRQPRNDAGRQPWITEVWLHKIIFAAGAGDTDVSATRQACLLALQRIEQDPALLSRLCNCF